MPHAEFVKNQIFHRLPESLCRQLFDSGEIETVPGGTTIVQEGEDLDRLFILLSGRVEVLLPESQMRVSAVHLTDLGPGDCFGEYAFIDDRPASATIRAAGDAEVYSISHARLRDFLDSHHAVASIIYQNLLGILVKRLRAANAELDLFTLSF